jgi:hypothetical protein
MKQFAALIPSGIYPSVRHHPAGDKQHVQKGFLT